MRDCRSLLGREGPVVPLGHFGHLARNERLLGTLHFPRTAPNWKAKLKARGLQLEPTGSTVLAHSLALEAWRWRSYSFMHCAKVLAR